MLEIIEEILSILDDMNDEIDGVSKYPISTTKIRAKRIREMRKNLQYIQCNQEKEDG